MTIGYRQSFYIVAIQAIGLVLGFVSIYLVAGDMGPEIYSLVGINTVVASVILTFSHLGVETTMMREALYWMKQGQIEKVKEYTTQALLSRFVGFLILAPVIIGYLLFLCFTKYEGQYLIILLTFYIGGCASALNDSLTLIVRAQGDFVFSQLVRTINSNLLKFLAIFVYIFWGAGPYLVFFSLMPISLIIVLFFKIRKYISWDYVILKDTIVKIKESKNLWLRTYMDYVSNSADSLLVSILFPSAIMGTYSLFKNLESIARSFIEGFFDVLLQKFVKYKGDANVLMTMEHKTNIARWAVIVLVIIGTALFSIKPQSFVNFVNLSKYSDIVLVIYTVAVISVLYLIGKNEATLISLLGPSRTILNIGIAMFIITVLSFLLVVIIPNIYGALLQRVLVYSSSALLSFVVFNKNRLNYYNNLYR